MPAVSQAQFRKMFGLFRAGKITKQQLDDSTKNVDYQRLPKHVEDDKIKKGPKK